MKSPMYWYAPEFDHDWKLDFRDLRRQEAEIRLQLRINGGHRGKVSRDILIWLTDVERIVNQVNRLSSQKSEIEMQFCASYSRLKVGRAEVKLVREVKSLLLKAPSLPISYGNSAVDGVAGQLVSPMLVGKSAQSILDQVCHYLTDPMIGIIGLYGKGGVGKTTIMKNVNNLLMNTDMFDKIFWVTLSQSATIETVQGEMALQLGITLPSEDIGKGGQRFEPLDWAAVVNGVPRYEKLAAALVRRHRASLISDNLKNLERCLFLLDDVWVHNINVSDFLTSMGIPEERTGSGCKYKVVLTTRSSQVCQQMRAQKEICVSPLSENEAWDLFVSRSGDHVLDSEIRHIAQEIVYECKGLPITVITIAHAMREEVSPIAWRRALEDLRSTNDVDVDKHISDLLRFGYSHLKKERIQKCFLYCAFFPEDFQFEARELIQYWIVEELIYKESIVASIDEGYQILKEIADANMLEPVMKGEYTWVRMHDLFRDLAVNIMTNELGFLVQAGHQLRRPYHSLRHTKKASLIRNQIKDLFFGDSDRMLAASDLSTLLLRENPLSYISISFQLLRNLQVLDISYTGIKELPSMYHLSKLRVLFLQYCTSLEELLPLEFCKELQFLNLRGTLIKEIPHGIGKLIKLRSLDLSETVRLENI